MEQQGATARSRGVSLGPMIGNAGRLALLAATTLGGVTAVAGTASAATALTPPSHADTVVTVLCCNAVATSPGAPSTARHCTPFPGGPSCGGMLYSCVTPGGTDIDILGGPSDVDADAGACVRIGIL
jgi:hypothetical protein